MKYVTSVERLAVKRGIQQGIERGLEQGRAEGRAALLGRQLTRRFSPLPRPSPNASPMPPPSSSTCGPSAFWTPTASTRCLSATDIQASSRRSETCTPLWPSSPGGPIRPGLPSFRICIPALGSRRCESPSLLRRSVRRSRHALHPVGAGLTATRPSLAAAPRVNHDHVVNS